MRKVVYFGSLVALAFATFLTVKTVAQFCEPSTFSAHGGVNGWSDARTQSYNLSDPFSLTPEISTFDAKSSVSITCPDSGRLCNVCYRVTVYVKNNFNQWIEVTYPTVTYNSGGATGTFGVTCGQTTNSDNNTVHVGGLTPGMTYKVFVNYGKPNGQGGCDLMWWHWVEFQTPQYADGEHEVPLIP